MDLNHLNYWQWWLLGLLFVVLEVFAPGAFFLWMGIASGVVGFILLLAPSLGWQYQFIVFSIFFIVGIATWRLYLLKHSTQTGRPSLSHRGEQYVGRCFILEYPIVDGIGKIQVGDSCWKIRGEDCEAGCRIRVTSVDGAILWVEKV